MKTYSLIAGNNFEKIKKEIAATKNPVIFTSKDDELNRKILEKIPIKILLLSLENRIDKSKQRNAGFNQVLAKIAKKNKIQIGINLDELIEANFKDKSRILSRISQNLMLCKKNNLQMQFIYQKNKRNLYDLKSLGLVLGMPTQMTKNLLLIKFSK